MRTHLLRFIAIILCLILATVANAATYSVNSTADPGDGTCDETCTLRDAILDANGNPGSDSIEFAIPGGSPHNIVVSTPLPTIVDQVIIDGNTQPDILIDGSSLVGIGDGLAVLAGGSGTEIRGLEIVAFPGDGIFAYEASGVTITDSVVRANNYAGIHLVGSGDNDIGLMGGGNSLIDNFPWGILLELESHGNRITDNDVWASNRGVFLVLGASDNNVTYNRIYDSGNQGIIAAVNTDRNDISYNYIENSAREGIEITGEAFDYGSGYTATENIVAHNVLVNNTHLDQIGDITLFSGAHGNVIKDNHITGSDDGIGIGIWLLINNNENQILNNVVVGAHIGLQVLPTARPLFDLGLIGGASWNVIKENEFRDSILDGINNTDPDPDWVGTFSDNIISENTVINSGRHGIHIANPDGLGIVTNNRVAENTIRNTVGDGVILDTDVNENRVTENAFKRIDGNGVTIFGDENRVDENKFGGVSGLDIDDQGIGNITE